MSIFDRFKKNSNLIPRIKPGPIGLTIDFLYGADKKKINLTAEKSKELIEQNPDIARALFDIENAVKQIGSIQVDSPDEQIGFSKEELSALNCTFKDGTVFISYKLISAIRFGEGTKLTGLTDKDLLALGVPKYSKLRFTLDSEGLYRDPGFRFSLKIFDSKKNEITSTNNIGHYLIGFDNKEYFINPLAMSLIRRVNEHLSNRKTPQYKSDIGIRIKDFSKVRESALIVHARLDEIIKLEDILFLPDLPYELGRDLEGEWLAAPRLPIDHKEHDSEFERSINSVDDIKDLSHINIKDNRSPQTSKRVFLSDKAKKTFSKIEQFNQLPREVKEQKAKEPEGFFENSPRENIGSSFSDRVSGFIIGKIQSNQSDTSSDIDWDKGFEEESVLLRAVDNSTVKIQVVRTPSEYSEIKESLSQLKEREAQGEIDKRNETGAFLTPLPREAPSHVYVECLRGEFSRVDLEQCIKRVETSNMPNLDEDEISLAQERVTQVDEAEPFLVKWGEEDEKIPLASLKRAISTISKEKREPKERISLAVEDSINALGQSPHWHWQSLSETEAQKVPGFKDKGEEAVSLYPHQKIGYNWLRWIFEHTPKGTEIRHRGALIADDMGLGKTIQVIALIAHIKSLAVLSDKPILIIAPLGLLQTSWRKDGLLAFLKPEVFGRIENPLENVDFFSNCCVNPDQKISKKEAERINKELSEAGKTIANCSIDSSIKDELKTVSDWCKGKLILTSYETARSRSIALAAVDFSLVILDEAQKIKNTGTLQSNSVKALKGDMYIAMTGTPIENSLMDLWSIMDFVLPGHLGTQRDFKDKFVNQVKSSAPGSKDRESVKKELEKALSPVWMRRTKKEIYGNSDELPEIIHYDSTSNKNEHAVRMSKEQDLVYSNQANFYKSVGSGGLPALQRMLEACSAPWLAKKLEVTYGKSGNQDELFRLSPKLKVTIDILEKIRKNSPEDGQKVIIFANRREIQRDLAYFVHAWNNNTSATPIEVEVYNGDIPEKQRGKMLDRFKDSSGFSVIIISTKAGGVGLNLTEANHVIHYTREWNPALERQATDRVYRLKQKRTVHVYYPTSLGLIKERPSAEEHLANLLRDKRQVMDDFTISNKDADLKESFAKSFKNTASSSSKIWISSNNIQSLNHKEFEGYIACLYEKKLGFQTYVVGRSDDKGVDVIALSLQKNLLIQVKHSSKGTSIGTKAIQEVRGAKSTYEAFTDKSYRLVAATNSNFNIKAKSLSDQGDEVELIEGAQISEMASDIYITLEDIERKLQEKPNFRLP